jgi:(1->4)-alpha-D-glucan 1-alpha-D-glucosylmutase
VEDTALYRFTRLASLNEVGGDPAVFGVSVRRFHADCRHRAGEWPHEMLATSTHDTKRSEDVRARINVLSEMPRRWRRSLRRWSHMNRARRRLVDEQPAPGPHAEYLFYQTLIGTWPLHAPGEAEFAAYRGRIEQYMVKAMREAKRRTAWLNVNAEYEEALCNFIRAALEQREGNLFLEELATFARGVARIGFLNSLSTTLCKLTAPGVPDIYQGNELWDFSLVDPDNRRPVDYPRRRQALAELQRACSDPARELDGLIGSLLQTPEDGRVKLYLTWRALALRRAHETLFREGAYLPMQTRGEHAPHVCAFARQLAGDAAVVAVPRLCERLLGARAALPLGGEVWADTVVVLPSRISARTFNDVFTGARIEALVGPGAAHLRAADVFARFPVALLVAG